MLTPHDLGHRVVVRRIVGVRDNRPIFSDVLGKLTDLTDTHACVATAGGLVSVPLAEISRAKRVPDQRRRSATEVLEAVAAAGWPAPETASLGDWLLRAATSSRRSVELCRRLSGTRLACATSAWVTSTEPARVRTVRP